MFPRIALRCSQPFCHQPVHRQLSGLRRIMAAFSTFHISLPSKPVYLRSCNDTRCVAVKVSSQSQSHFAGFSGKIQTLYVLERNSVDNNEAVDETNLSWEKLYVKSCLWTQSTYRQLMELEGLTSNFDFSLGTRKFKNGALRRQLYAFPADDAFQTDTLLRHTQQLDCLVHVYERRDEHSDGPPSWVLREPLGEVNGQAVIKMPLALAECGDSAEARVRVSPIFQDSGFSPVFHSYERAMDVLDMYKECREVQQLLKIAGEELAQRKSLPQLVSMMKLPLVVVEGMDATGKTTLTEFLEKRLDAARYSTPPPCLLPLRKFFDRLPEIVRRAYYSLGNYIVAQQIALECQTRAVVMDRYWHSTAAYGIANETSYDDMPPPNHRDYRWPADLLKPTAVVFLTVSEDVRRERLGHRHEENITFEERKLNKDKLFRARLREAYLRMREPECVQVDAGGSKSQVVEAVLAQLQSQGLQLT